MRHGGHKLTTKLDSCANMPVAGAHSMLISQPGLYAEVAACYPDLLSWKIEIVDLVLAHDDHYSLKTYLLVVKNTLRIPPMDQNLVTPFILWEAGSKVNEEAKLHADNLIIDHHDIYDDKTKLRIHLQLKGALPYFPTCELSCQECENWEDCDVIFLTTDAATWDTNLEYFVLEEDDMPDAKGDIATCDEK